MIVRRPCILALLSLAFSAAAAAAQSASCATPRSMRMVFDDPRAELIRAAEVRGATRDRAPMFQRREMDRTVVCADSIALLADWGTAPDSVGVGVMGGVVEILPPSLRASHNTAYPRERNNGAFVETVGLGTVLDFGVAAQWRWLSVVLAPRVTYQANDDFDFPLARFDGRPEYSHPYQEAIDFPKRFGPDSWSELSPGASRVEFALGPVAAGLSTANMWIGPMHRFPIIMSNTAPGFPHGYVGTRSPIDFYAFNLELNAFWGEAAESDWFDGDEDNDGHYVTGFELAASTRLLPGIQVGFSRIYHDSASITGMKAADLWDTLIETPLWTSGGNRIGNGIGALYLRWVLPESGFEAYAEWSREDTPFNLEDVLREPDWTQAYALGFQKTYQTDRTMSRLYGELIHLGEAAPVRAGKGFFSYYTHGVVRQGHTNRGQILGAAIGPGSDAQAIGYELFTAMSRTHVGIERTRYDDDTYYRRFARRWGEARHDVEITLELSHMQRIAALRGVELEGGVNVSRRYDRDFITLNRQDGERLIETNWNPWVRVSWRPDLRH